ncbi:OsmC family protein [Arenibaculum pallidiluteum]|uniref:OsmC family protein n=1 Tax=Arenibaculum pallidiluteum TaxID=2812559 RepID=UPI001A97C6CF|nr:OsmC family protein [Arenibaculum pallidiluteum]
MAGREHRYTVAVTWTGNTGSGTAGYKAYERAHEIAVPDASPTKPVIPGSSDPAFRGDPARWNPEELLVASVSACHKLWYLHLCAAAGIVVTSYADRAEGVMVETADGGGHFARIVLRPEITILPGGDAAKAEALHATAHARCFIANSLNFPVLTEPTIRTGE